jgi:hypothetical protein
VLQAALRWPVLAAPAAHGWDHLLVDPDDPEHRIARLERQLSEQSRDAQPRPTGKARRPSQPAGSDRAAASRRFVATTFRRKNWVWLCSCAAFAAVLGLMYLAAARTTHWVVVVLAVVGLILVGSCSVIGFRQWGVYEKIPICVTSDGLTLDERPGELFSFDDAKLGLWPGIAMSGTALHLQCGPHGFVLGGRDHRLGTATPLQAPPTGGVDGWLRAADFDEVLAVVARRSGLDVRGPAPGEPRRCLLYGPGEPMGPFQFRVKQTTPEPHLAIDVGTDAIWVIDPNTNALLASASRAQVTAEPAIYEETVGNDSTSKVPVLVLGVPDLQPLTIRCRRAWRDKVPRQKAKPEFWVSDADSQALVELFGLTANLKG